MLFRKGREKHNLATVGCSVAVMEIEMTCPICSSHEISKNNITRRDKQHYDYRDCERQHVEYPQWKAKDKDTFGLVSLLLIEKILLVGIARVTQISGDWLQEYVNDAYAAVLGTAAVVPKAKLTVQIHKLWSFVTDRGNKQWNWLIIDADTRDIIGCHIGNRSRTSARQFWQSLLAVYRQCVKFYTDYWEAYETVILSKRHFAVGKENGLTSYIKRLNNMFHQRVPRLVGNLLSLSKKLENHLGGIWTFIRKYNRLDRERVIKSDHPSISFARYSKALPRFVHIVLFREIQN